MLSSIINPIRGLATKALPTVFEPLPAKRNGQPVMTYLQQKLLEKHDPTGKRRSLVDRATGLRAGDVIKVTYADRTDILGQIVAIKRGYNNLGTNILIRNKITRVGCEVRVPLYSPKLRSIEVLEKPKEYNARAKQYYIRNSKRDVDDLEAVMKRKTKKAAEKSERSEKKH